MAIINARTSVLSIRNSSENRNHNFTEDDITFSERDFIPEDRELLMLEASELGVSKEDRAYSNKVKALDGLSFKASRGEGLKKQIIYPAPSTLPALWRPPKV